MQAQKYNFQVLDLENDLDIALVKTMSCSEKGFLLLAGNESVLRFDGKTAESYLPNFTLPFTEITKILEEGDDLFVLANNQLFKYGESDPIFVESVNSFVIKDSVIIYGSDKGVKFFDQARNVIDKPESLSKLDGFNVSDLLLSDNQLFIGTNQGLYSFNFTTRSLDEIKLNFSGQLDHLVMDNRGEIWCGDQSGTVFKINSTTRNATPFFNEGFDIVDINVDSVNRIWIGSANKGMLRFDQNLDRWTTIDQQHGLPDSRVVDILTDAWGIVWIVTADQSLSKFIDRDYVLYNVYDGLASDQITAITTYNQDIIFSCGGKGVFALSDGNISTLYTLNVKSEGIYMDSSELWIGTNGSGLIRIRDSESTVFRKSAGLPSDWINNVVKDRDGTVWVSTPSNGIAQLSQMDSFSMRVTTYGEEEGLKDIHITSLFAHSSGMILYGTQSGNIGVLNEKGPRLLPLNEVTSEITDIVEGDFGEVYISSINSGIVRYNPMGKASFEVLDTLGPGVKAIGYKQGRLWAVSDKGITNGIAQFSTGEGFPSKQVVKGGMVMLDNRLWVASNDGLINVGNISNATTINQPKLFFKQIQVNYTPVELISRGYDGNDMFNFNGNQIGFEYEGVDIHANRNLLYSYILEGQDKMWSPWTKNNNPSFNNLAAGNYTFSVRAKSGETAISEPLSFSFIVNGPIWKKWWFIASIFLSIMLLGYLIFKSRINRIRRKNQEEKAQLELKNRLLELEQKSNQLQMNPHFIFNALNSIQATVAKEDYQDARREITDFATLMRSILSNSKERVIPLTDELKLIRKYIDIERQCRSLDFKDQFVIDENIDQEELLIPPMLIQPFIENAIVHGLAKKIDGLLTIKFSIFKENILLVNIEDNGIGYENAKAKSVNKKHKSVAIEVTKERLENILDKKYHPAVSIQQVSDEGGTKVDLKIPIEYNF